MRYQLLSNTVRTFNSIKHEADRPDWKNKKISPSQISVLAQHIELSDLFMLDRGSASLLLDCIFKLKNVNEQITDRSMLSELNKILYD